MDAKQSKVLTVEPPKSRYIDTFIKMFSAGTGASMAEIVTIPIDTAKVRLQVIKNTIKHLDYNSRVPARLDLFRRVLHVFFIRNRFIRNSSRLSSEN